MTHRVFTLVNKSRHVYRPRLKVFNWTPKKYMSCWVAKGGFGTNGVFACPPVFVETNDLRPDVGQKTARVTS